jgi:hypothetical protein
MVLMKQFLEIINGCVNFETLLIWDGGISSRIITETFPVVV